MVRVLRFLLWANILSIPLNIIGAYGTFRTHPNLAIGNLAAILVNIVAIVFLVLGLKANGERVWRR